MDRPTTHTAKVWRVRVLTTTWLSYAGYYFCRKNYAIAKTSVRDMLEISNSELAHIFTAYLVAYMLGQFLTSFLGRRTAARVLLLAGMGVTLVCNILFGLTTLMGPAGYWPMVLLMVVNGFAQATGWPGNVGVLCNWLKRSERGKTMAVWATSYQLGSILAKGFAAFMLGWLGLAWSFWGASAIMFGIWILFLLFERDSPEEAGLPPLVEEVEVEVVTSTAGNKGGTLSGLGWTRQTVVTIVMMGITYFVFKFLRYSLDSWSPLAIEGLFGLSPERAGYLSTMFDWVGFLGVLAAGWASDRFFAGRRYQMILVMTVGMVFAFVFLALIGIHSIALFATGLALCGFMLMGPDSLLSGAGAIDVGGRKGAIVAAGLINGLGSIGPIFQEEVIGWLLDNHGLTSVLTMLIGISALGIIGTGALALRSRRGLSSL
jgi:MFS transporter, OPA family, sugar phosphate sensor protein UhpC